MNLSKGKILKRILALFLMLMIPAGSVRASEVRMQDDNAAEDVLEEEESEKQTRIIEVEEELTKVCGEIFYLDVKLTENPDSDDTKQTDPEDTKQPDSEDTKQQDSEAETGKSGEINKGQQENEAEPEKIADEATDGEQEAEEVLQYEISDTEIAVIEEDESGKVQIRTIGAGDTIIKITAPETEDFAQAVAQVILHVTASEEENLPELSEEESLPELSEEESLPEPSEPESYALTAGEVPVMAMSLLPSSNLSLLENVADGISLKWSRVEGAAGYYLERSTTGRSPWSKVKTAVNADDVTFVDTQVTEGATYYYRVRAFDHAGQEGLTGASKKIIRLAAPTLSVGLAATGNELKWNRVTGCSGYYVYRRASSKSSWTVVTTITQPGEITWRDTAAGNGKTYTYSVRAYKGGSLSPYAGAKSYVRVTAPTIKSLKRKSATKYTVSWKTNTSATGYQIQYAQNGMFVGAKKVTVKSAKKSSYTLSKLEKNKNYYARIRAYKKVGGKTYYSDWSAAGNVTKTRTATVQLLTKKKKAFEIRTWAKQKMYQYDTLEGSCTDGTYAYYLLYNRKVVNCKIVKVKRSNLTVVKVSEALDVAHGNDMTYDSDKKRLVIVHSTGVDPKRLTSVNPKTLTVTDSKHVLIPAKLAGGTTADAAGATAFTGLAYSSGRKQYAVLLSHNYNFVVLDANMDPVRYVKVSKKNNYTVQGIDATDDYIMVAQSPKTSKQTYNIITVYDWDGNYISKINVKKGYEIESIYHVGSKYYAGFYCSYYKTSYKNVIKNVKVNGKVTKKKVKVKYREYLRDNYVYQIKGI